MMTAVPHQSAQDTACTTPAFRAHTLTPGQRALKLEVRATDLAGLFEETATALGSLCGGYEGARPTTWEIATLEARGLPELATAWTNTILSASHLLDAEVVTVCIDRLAPLPERPASWRLAARLGFHRGPSRPLHARAVNVRSLTVDRSDDDLWRLRVNLEA